MIRTLQSGSRMRYLLGNNPMGELIRIVQREFNKIDERKQTPMGNGDK